MSWTMTLLMIWTAMAAVMTAGWLWQRRRDNAGIVDVLWSAGVGAGAVACAAFGAGDARVRLLVAVCGGLWGLRLAWHLWRRVRSEDEDGRYRHLRAHWHGHQGKFFLFFQFQALLVPLFCLPFAAAAANASLRVPWLAAGVAVWALAWAGEAVADRQLARFRADPGNRGRTCDTGLWRYSRHPNYFSEWLHWFAYALFAVGSPLAWVAWTGPATMYLFVRYLSGVPFTEAQALRTRGEDYRRYQQRTPMFFPWFPRASRERSAQEKAQ
nr:hypothetical protein [Lysobacter sp.]